jgi:hypothetical protein
MNSSLEKGKGQTWEGSADSMTRQIAIFVFANLRNSSLAKAIKAKV